MKDFAANWAGVSHDVLHVHVGLALFFLCAFVLRRRRLWPIYAWGFVLVLELMNETADTIEWIGWTGHGNWGESAKDILNTMLWPTILVLLVFRWRRTRLPLAAQQSGRP